MLLRKRSLGPQGLKPAFLADLNGTAEAVPYPKPIYETSSGSLASLKMKAYTYVADLLDTILAAIDIPSTSGVSSESPALPH